MQVGGERAEPQCYQGLNEPVGRPLSFALGAWPCRRRPSAPPSASRRAPRALGRPLILAPRAGSDRSGALA